MKGVRKVYDDNLPSSAEKRKLSGVNFINVFTRNFYAHRSQKRKNDSQVIGHFALLGSTCIKTVHKHVGDSDPEVQNRKKSKSYIRVMEKGGVSTTVLKGVSKGYQ